MQNKLSGLALTRAAPTNLSQDDGCDFILLDLLLFQFLQTNTLSMFIILYSLEYFFVFHEIKESLVFFTFVLVTVGYAIFYANEKPQ